MRPFSKIKKLTPLRSNPEDFVLRTLLSSMAHILTYFGQEEGRTNEQDLVIWARKTEDGVGSRFFCYLCGLGQTFFFLAHFMKTYFLCIIFLVQALGRLSL